MSHARRSRSDISGRLRKRCLSFGVRSSAICSGSSTRLRRRARSCRCASGASSTPTPTDLPTMAPSNDGPGTSPDDWPARTGTSSVLASAWVPPGTCRVLPGGVVVRSVRGPSPSGANTSIVTECLRYRCANPSGEVPSSWNPIPLDCQYKSLNTPRHQSVIHKHIKIGGHPGRRYAILHGVKENHLSSDQGPITCL